MATKKIKMLATTVAALSVLNATGYAVAEKGGTPKTQTVVASTQESADVTYSVGGSVMTKTGGFATKNYLQGVMEQYDLPTALIPVWESATVYNETVAFVGAGSTAKLLYTPTRIVKVTDYYLRCEYKEGVDFTVEGNVIKLTENSRIKYWEESLLYADTQETSIELKVGSGAYTGKYIHYSEVEANRHQICVTYTHAGNWTGAIPVGQSEKLPKTLAKLENGEGLRIGVIGDSITFGAGASKKTKSDPSQPWYAELVGDYLQAKYPNADITLDNQAVGGTIAAWGAENISRFTTAPDLAIVAFGMNDSGTSLESYSASIASMISQFKTMNADCEIILVSTMLPNPEALNWTGNIPDFENELVKIAEAEPSIALVPMTTMSQALYGMGKRFIDVNSNNINHPNDFLHRIYAQCVLKVMLGDDFTALL